MHITPDHVDILPQIEIELFRLWERRKRSQEEAEYQRRRNDVRIHYEHLKIASVEPLPNLATFRQIPIIKMLQAKTSANNGIAKELNTEAVGTIIRIYIKRLREQAREGLSQTLGLTWKDIIDCSLHPLDKATSWFQCKHCKKLAGKYSGTPSLDFAGVFGHECSSKVKKNKAWNVEQFVPDFKVVSPSTWISSFSPIFCRHLLQRRKHLNVWGSGPKILTLWPS
jgi:hypothetical protein